MPNEAPSQPFGDRLFIGEELDTPRHEIERTERLVQMCTLSHRLLPKSGSVDTGRSNRVAVLVSDTRDSLKKVNGEEFEDGEEDVEEGDTTGDACLDVEQPSSGRPLMARGQHFRAIKRNHDEMEVGHFEPLP